MCYKSEILIGFFEGIFGGLGVVIIKVIYDFYIRYRDEKGVKDFLNKESKDKWHTTYFITANINLTEDSVRFICSVSKGIDRSELEKEVWQLK